MAVPGSLMAPSLEMVKTTDKDGYSYSQFRVLGTEILMPPFPDFDVRLKQLPQLEAREDDIFLCGYPKCGTHWVWETVGMLLQGRPDYIPTVKESLMLEIADNATMDAQVSPRVINTHLSPEFLPKQFFDKKCKIVYLLRNPKDMLVSMYNHTFNLLPFYGYEGKWSGYFELFMEGKVDYGDWSRYVLGWEEFISSRPDLPIHTLYYEDMKRDSASEISKLALFLGLGSQKDLHKDIAEKCSFGKMKEMKAKFEKGSEYWRDKKPSMYRKGEVGDWKNWFTVAQNERFDQLLTFLPQNCSLHINSDVSHDMYLFL